MGRKEIMDFINTTLDLRLNKVEDTASGCVACQLLDILYPNTILMNKVNWSANKDFEYVANYKILQTGFTKLHIDRHIDVDRLISGKYMDNLEFMQWFKRYYELNNGDNTDYDCKGQRGKGKGGAAMSSSSNAKPSSVPVAVKTIASTGTKPVGKVTTTTKPSTAPSTTTAHAPPAVKKSASVLTAPTSKTTTAINKFDDAVHTTALNKEIETLKNNNEETQRAFADLRGEMDGLEKERDFYFVSVSCMIICICVSGSVIIYTDMYLSVWHNFLLYLAH